MKERNVREEKKQIIMRLMKGRKERTNERKKKILNRKEESKKEK